MDAALYNQVYDWHNLLLAYRNASRGKRGRDPAARFERTQHRIEKTTNGEAE